MIKILKNKKNKKNIIYFTSSLGNIQIYFIDKIFNIPLNVDINIKKNIIYFKNLSKILNLKYSQNIYFIKKNKKLIIIINLKNKKSFLNLYTKLIKIKLKGILQGFKLNLILKGIGFKVNIQNNYLKLKIGFSHNILILIPINIKIINQANNLIFSSNDLIFLTQYVNYIKNFKKPEPYKGKGFLFKNEKIFKKEGKKNKK